MDGSIKAIELQGIVHNETKIGVKDGQCEDLVNLRFKDGSWRTSGDGKLVYNLTDTYEELYVHTNVYRHLLGVKYADTTKTNGTLYWIANIVDGVFKSLPTPIEITSVVGKVSITQTGHLITIIDEADDFEFFVYKTGENQYIQGNIDVNGSQSDKTLFPFGRIHFNLYSPIDEDHTFVREVDSTEITKETISVSHSALINVMEDARKKNKFLMPFMILAAYKLYDGSYAYASNPVILYPRQTSSSGNQYQKVKSSVSTSGVVTETSSVRENVTDNISFVYNVAVMKNPSDFAFPNFDDDAAKDLFAYKAACIRKANFGSASGAGVLEYVPDKCLPSLCNGFGSYVNINGSQSTNMVCYDREGNEVATKTKHLAHAFGSDIIVSIDNKKFLENNSGIFSSLCFFITPEVSNFYDASDGYKESDQYKATSKSNLSSGTQTVNITYTSAGVKKTIPYESGAVSYFPKRYTDYDVAHKLSHQNFALLKEYDANNISELFDTGIIDLSKIEDEGILATINKGASSDLLPNESITRTTYLPKVSYAYNGRLHIANYKQTQFHGYPITMMQMNNHSLKYEDGGVYFELENVEDNNDSFLQWARERLSLYANDDMIENNAPTFIEVVTIETSSGTQKVCRYIPSGGRGSIEDLDCMLTFPDYRASHIDLYYAKSFGVGKQNVGLKHKQFKLKTHPYLNLAYYINDGLKPISLSSFEFIQNRIM